ncbi:hypothetical protein F2Q70_00010947 [Brassica cretica]|uniref:Uncharacterized protein n=1 Tax=Brassica cretica TaxID=69181 RepID=A0A8S9LWL7_BRACR|nr:hypothetical protein F2Q68_00004059 [Brassica cretica]KAF2610221.1 hypothetical protein F2Q70_00010947 [Brassica cretica]
MVVNSVSAYHLIDGCFIVYFSWVSFLGGFLPSQRISEIWVDPREGIISWYSLPGLICGLLWHLVEFWFELLW